MNVLITSASRKVSLVKSFQKALLEEGGGKVVAVDVSPAAAALYVADEHCLVPRSDAPDFVSDIIDLCKRSDVSLIVPTRDEELPVFAQAKARLSSNGIHVMVADLPVVALCQNKKLFSRFCSDNDFGVPRVFKDNAVVTDSDLPVFVRSVCGKGSKGAWRVEEIAALQSIVREGGDYLVQECIDAPEYTVDLFADSTGKAVSAVVRERELVFGGESFVATTVRNDLVLEEACRLSESMNLVGHNTLQCFVDEGAVKWIEINPRYGGGASLGFEAGAFTPQYLIRMVRGDPVDVSPGIYKEGLTMLRYTEDLFLNTDAMAGV